MGVSRKTQQRKAPDTKPEDPSSTPRTQEDRTNSSKLSSDCHTHRVGYVHSPTSTHHTHSTNVKGILMDKNVKIRLTAEK